MALIQADASGHPKLSKELATSVFVLKESIITHSTITIIGILNMRLNLLFWQKPTELIQVACPAQLYAVSRANYIFVFGHENNGKVNSISKLSPRIPSFCDFFQYTKLLPSSEFCLAEQSVSQDLQGHEF